MDNSKEILKKSGPSYPISPKYPKTCITQSSIGLYTRATSHMMQTVSWTLFVYLHPWFGIFGLNFPDLPLFSKNTKTVINRLPHGLYTSARLHFMWNVELTHWMNFCVPIFGGHSTRFPQLTTMPKYTKTSITWALDGFYTCVRLHHMWNLEFST